LNLGLNFLNDTVAGVTNSGSTALAFLGEPLPLINVSLRDILGYATSFSNFLTRLVNNPSDNLQDLADQISQAIKDLTGQDVAINLGLETSLTAATKALTTGLDNPAHFTITLDGGTPTDVTVPQDTNATSAAALVSDINAALKGAGLGGQIQAQ